MKASPVGPGPGGSPVPRANTTSVSGHGAAVADAVRALAEIPGSREVTSGNAAAASPPTIDRFMQCRVSTSTPIPFAVMHVPGSADFVERPSLTHLRQQC